MDGIYPTYAAFVKSFKDPQSARHKNFAKTQEAVRTDVERAFGVLQTRFAIVAGPARMRSQETLHDIMTTCIILHNMIVENGRGEKEYVGEGNGVEREVVRERYEVDTSLNGMTSLMPRSEIVLPDRSFTSFIQRYMAIQNCEQHFQLRHDLVESLWQRKGDSLIK
ncbi:hypothetical protein PHYBLDRAFT_164927 [Phycomyces blakesleeanus NRRL 1555(-)]|uniref:DDE Tnp4 domain-containing protein n=1 Tax=Phycomyces blakesleeanus (strain ATCC 8743b / DSM 1359 / FGSC 10004 / NBRC 33097 / NRRL 1555) TaxID=763407 RepID=A0A167PJ42_PHYB8|nr:hypothetical protein PHYBLDRAFT_164927 [Phycomyces blakesleeanus NRRL 1555(-)]OAD78047.1 hypothetical protein PHYBLDRAFT_164927 [Phycomyces blakesleeanus NRRL 1555(-)]|eukprot:XP_018296087.1 hypothetical protein PHYBLDRAFT_164927 [Phycomyces blakesleeanus NRRL 1555(-)]